MKTLIPWIAGWIVFCGGLAVASIAVELCALHGNYSRIYAATVNVFIFAVIGMVLGSIGLLVCR